LSHINECSKKLNLQPFLGTMILTFGKVSVENYNQFCGCNFERFSTLSRKLNRPMIYCQPDGKNRIFPSVPHVCLSPRLQFSFGFDACRIHWPALHGKLCA